MIAALDPTAVYTAMITMLGLVLSTLGVAVVNLRSGAKRGQEAVEARENIQAQLTPTNGYDSLGDGIQAVEDKLNDIDERLRTHLEEVDPILQRALPLMERVERMKTDG